LIEFFFDNDITESACRCIKHSIRALDLAFTPYVDGFLKHIAQGYEQKANGSFVYALENCFSNFGADGQFAEFFQEAFNFFI